MAAAPDAAEKSFGRVFAVVFAAIGLWPLLNGNPPYPWLLAAAVLMLGLAQFLPRTLRAPARLWLSFGNALHRITNPLILGLLFFGVFTPLGLSLRGLRRRFVGKRGRASYWIPRQPPGPKPESLRQQF